MHNKLFISSGFDQVNLSWIIPILNDFIKLRKIDGIVFESKLDFYQANNNQLSYILITFSIIQIFFIFLPSGQFFNNYLSILYYLPLGIFLNLNYNYHDNDK